MSFWTEMRYCPKCGTPFATGGFEQTPYPTCAACGFIFWRNPALAAGCMVIEGGRLLLAKRGIAPFHGSWYVPSGFVDYGETPESAAARELLEEAGLTVRITALYDVRTWRDDPRKEGVMLFYTAERVAGEAMAGDDAAAVGWFAPDALPEPISFAIHRAVIHRWRDETTNSQPRSREEHEEDTKRKI